jgi:hypothetical protein
VTVDGILLGCFSTQLYGDFALRRQQTKESVNIEIKIHGRAALTEVWWQFDAGFL